MFRRTPLPALFTGDRDGNQRHLLAAAREPVFRAELRDLIAISGARLVDVGCDSGEFLGLAGAAGWTAIGIDLDRAATRRARATGRSVARADAAHAPLRSGCAAVVTMWDVLDHLEAPQSALLEAARLLCPGGSLRLRVRHGTVHGIMRRQRWLPRDLSVLHNNAFSPRCLRLALENAGFRDVRIAPSPSSVGDPYAIAGTWMYAAKRCWDLAARIAARITGGRLVISPSLAVHATRAGRSQVPHE